MNLNVGMPHQTSKKPNSLKERTLDQQIDWFVLENGEYQNLEPDVNGMLCSREFTGLWLNVNALLSHDMAAVLKTLQTGQKIIP